MKSKDCVYVLITADRHELPVSVADTLEDMSIRINIKPITLYQAFERNSLISGRFRLIKVDIGDIVFNFEGYHKFCKTENLKPGYATSLQKFREYIGADYDCGL